MSTQVSNPYSFNIVNNTTFSTSILNDLTMIGNAQFNIWGSSPNRGLRITTRALRFSDGQGGTTSFNKTGSFDQLNNTEISLVSLGIDDPESGILGADCVIFISSSSNRVKYAAYAEIDDAYRIGVYLGYKINSDVYSNANGARYYGSTVWKKNGSSFSEATSTDVIDYLASKNYKCNLKIWIKAS